MSYIKCHWYCNQIDTKHVAQRTQRKHTHTTHTHTHTHTRRCTDRILLKSERDPKRGGVEKEQESRGWRGGRVVVAVFIDNKWWDALVSARPTEPDDRRAAERSCDRITHSGALWEVPLSNREGRTERERERERERGTSGEAERVGGEGNRGGRKLPMNPTVPIALFQLSCIQTNFFFTLHLGGRASLPLFGRWPQLPDAVTTLFRNPTEQKPLSRQHRRKRWQLRRCAFFYERWHFPM